MSYKYLEGITMADVAFEATGANINELFESAGLAVTNTMVQELASVKHHVTELVELDGDTVEKLLFRFLNEIVYLKDAKQLLFSKMVVDIKESTGIFYLKAHLSGEKLDMHKHELIVDIKAVTMHTFEVTQTKGQWKCQVVVDI